MKRKRVIIYSKNDSSLPQETSSKLVSNSTNRLKKSTPSPIVPKINNKVKINSQELVTTQNDGDTQYFSVTWCQRSKKVHKTYQDGVLIIKGNQCTLYDMDNKQIGISKGVIKTFNEDSELNISDKEVLFGNKINADDYISGRIFKSGMVEQEIVKNDFLEKHKNTTKKGPLHKSNKLMPTNSKPLLTPKFALNKDSVILYEPPEGCVDKVHVILEPHLASKMRPHQIEGVKFMYECVTGLRVLHNGEKTKGCILADVMGIGKTLQGIALIRTMLTQSPLGFKRPHANKAIVVTPSSLVKPWVKEINLWLGKERLKPVWIGEDAKKETKLKVENFCNSQVSPLIIISYEQLRLNIDTISKVKFGLMICDEGHRLKNPYSKTTMALNELDCVHRVVLTGTPFQNNFDEYFTLIDFVNPGVVGTQAEFRKNFEKPITKGREPKASKKDIEIGIEAEDTLRNIVSTFILRRTSKVLEKFLPPKVEQIVFCKPTQIQKDIYLKILESTDIDSLCNGSNSLITMTQLAKVCNHPELLLPKDETQSLSPLQEEILDYFTTNIMKFKRNSYFTNFSSKMIVLEQLVDSIHKNTKDKIVIVSSYTKTLDVIQNICNKHQWSFVRLDGSTDMTKRQYSVDTFQSDPNCFIFLLSTKAGAVGLNLFAANRLVLFDSQWNPAFDIQAQARVWRDGQTKKTYIYRLLVTGMIDEKIFQRQLVKTDMSKSVSTDSNSFSSSMATKFSPEELRNIFSYNDDTICDTHDMSGCQCYDNDLVSRKKVKNKNKKRAIEVDKKTIGEFNHFKDIHLSLDPLLSKIDASQPVTNNNSDEIGCKNIISFLFYKETDPSEL